MNPNNLASRVRFGMFEVDFRTQEMWKDGIKVKLTGQPLQILEALLARPGDLITREELQKRLWPGDSFVDFSHGLNAAVNKLRDTLDDSADNPRHIETLPRRGYRFMGEVETVVQKVEIVHPVAEQAVVSTVEALPVLARAVDEAAVARRSRKNWWLPAVTIAAGVVLIVGRAAFESGQARLPRVPGPQTSGMQLPKQEVEPLAESGVTLAPAVAKRTLTARRSQESGSSDEQRSVPTFRTVVADQSGNAGPQFSPDGKRIAFMSNRGGPWQIWVSDVDGSNARQVSTTDSAGTPRWSPDGRNIAYDAPIGENTYIFVQRVDSRELPRPLVEGKVPSFSRDGRWVYFASGQTGEWQVWKAPVNGGEPVQVTRRGGFAALESPDGYLYYAKSDGYSPEIWRTPVAGGEEARMSSRLRPRTWASWTVTKEGILFVEELPNREPELSFYQPERGEVRDVVSLRSAPFWMGATLDGKRAVMNDAGERQITMVENLALMK